MGVDAGLAAGEPAADGLVVGVEEEGGQKDAAHEGDDGHGPHVGHGTGNVGEAVVAVEEVHEWVVDDVEGVGQLAEESSGSRGR